MPCGRDFHAVKTPKSYRLPKKTPKLFNKYRDSPFFSLSRYLLIKVVKKGNLVTRRALSPTHTAFDRVTFCGNLKFKKVT